MRIKDACPFSAALGQGIDEFDVHRACLVFDLPRFSRVITREEGRAPAHGR